MVSAFDSRLRGPGLIPASAGSLSCVLEQDIFTLTVPLSTQEYKWVPVNCQGNLTTCWGLPALDWRPIQEE